VFIMSKFRVGSATRISVIVVAAASVVVILLVLTVAVLVKRRGDASDNMEPNDSPVELMNLKDDTD
jgi:hypothetical protein